MQDLKNGHNVLDTDKIGRLLMKLTLPMFFGSVVQAIYAVIDTVFIGHYVGPLGMAGLAIVFPLQMFAMGIGMMVGMGGGSLISRLIGAGDRPRAEHALGNSIMLSLFFSAVLMLGVLPFLNFWVRLIGATEAVVPYARDYLLFTYLGVVFNIVGAVLLMLIRAEGNTRIAMISMTIQSIINILLDWVFIKVMGMGMAGAALAMLVAQAIAMLYALSYYITNSSYLKIHIVKFKPDFKILKAIFAIGISQFGQSVATSAAALLLVNRMAAYGGELALSAFGILQRVMWFSMIPGQVLGQGMQPILGFNYGARRWSMALKVMNISFFYSILFSLLAFIFLFIWPEVLIRIFTDDTAVIEATARATRFIFVIMPLLGFFNVGQMVFPSIGKAVESFIIAIARPVVFMIPLVFILPPFFGLDGVWAAFPGADLFTFLLTLGMLIPLFKRFKRDAASQATTVQ